MSCKHESVCDEAKEITGNNRMKEYGHPSHNFSDIASLWNAFLGNKITKCDREGKMPTPLLDKKDVAMMMTLFKIAREQAGHKRDNIVDGIGYLRNAAQIQGLE
jgi:hypothetical protein|tara:strand:- start:653 stop:964 length:312 start_codon:yes stop_codon:yes gene_type:complete